jgi:hypothetical protein
MIFANLVFNLLILVMEIIIGLKKAIIYIRNKRRDKKYGMESPDPQNKKRTPDINSSHRMNTNNELVGKVTKDEFDDITI